MGEFAKIKEKRKNPYSILSSSQSTQQPSVSNNAISADAIKFVATMKQQTRRNLSNSCRTFVRIDTSL